MTRKEKLQNLLGARNILHKKESGEELLDSDILIAHDLIDMVIDAMVDEDFQRRMRKK